MSRNVHQDYIVRQRYSNALPPPPGAPKLLDIPTGGLKQYTMPTYASRLARVQPLNIEADADLGMPIDLVGMPGVFEGDETAILAPLHRPTPHPADRNLLRPLKEIGQAKKEGGISFLRRTQYTADGGVARGAGAPTMGITPRKRRVEAFKDDPRAILRTTMKGFDLANPEDAHTGSEAAERIKGVQPTPAEADAWKHPKHPTNKALKPVDFYPVLPDMEAMPADGGYMVVRFHGDPGAVEDDDFKVPDSCRADPRIDTSLLQLVDTPAETMAEYTVRKELFDKDPEKHKDPGLPPFEYQYYLPVDLSNTENAVKAFDAGVTPADRVEQLYSTLDEENPDKNGFHFKHARFYETRSNLEHPTRYERVAMVLHDGDDAAEEEDDLGLGDDDAVRKLPKGAYYAPTANTIFLKPRRKIVTTGREAARDESRIDVLHVRPKEMDGKIGETRKAIVDELQP